MSDRWAIGLGEISDPLWASAQAVNDSQTRGMTHGLAQPDLHFENLAGTHRIIPPFNAPSG